MTKAKPPPTTETRSTSKLLTPADLMTRWRDSVTLATLATWRSRRLGPSYVKVGGRVLYPEHEVEAWEQRRTIKQ